MSVVHGGDVEAVARAYGADASALVDFSANIAPDGPPAGVACVLSEFAARPRLLAPYPSASYAPLCAQIAAALDIESESVVLGHGSAALIDLALRACARGDWLVPTPAFSEYRRATNAALVRFRAFPLPETFEFDVDAFVARLRALADAGAIVNTPHNPSGAALEHRETLAVLEACEELRRPAIVDEAFIDYVPERSIAREAVRSRCAVVVRSLTKFYALAGVRVGYALAHPDLARRMVALAPSWPVGTLDREIACAALRDDDYIRRTRERNLRAREDLARDLAACGFPVFNSYANFLLVDVPVPFERFDAFIAALVDEGVVVRDCRSYEGLELRTLIRVAVLDEARNRRLAKALATARQRC